MVVTDPIADMLTRIRNANIARIKQVEVPASNIKKELARLLKEEGYIQDYELIEDNKQGVIRLYLKFNGKKRGNNRTEADQPAGATGLCGKGSDPESTRGLGRRHSFHFQRSREPIKLPARWELEAKSSVLSGKSLVLKQAVAEFIMI